jgi:hypothetical protein
VAACSSGADHRRLPDAQPLRSAMTELTRVIIYDILNPPQAARVYAYASVAAFEALRHADTGYRSLGGQLNGLAAVPQPDPEVEYSFPLASLQAFMTVGRALTFSQARMDSLRSAMTQQLAQGLSRGVVARSLAYGDTVAAHILAWSAQDKYKESRGYPKFTVTSAPGRWLPTPPAYMDAVEPHWSALRPWVMDSASQLKPEPPYAFSTAPSSDFFRDAREVYEVTKNMSDDQRAVALFWDDSPFVMHVRGHAMFATKKMSPGGHWMNITGLAASKTGANMLQTAEAYARTAIAIAEGFISCWDEKYRSNLIRPETVINRYIDEHWQPVLQTPPFPEYTSGHSVISAAAATVLTETFGDNFAFADSTELDFGIPVREFASFHEAAAEAALSRLYGGIHYRRAIEQGVMQGRRVGQLVLQRAQTRGSSALIATER